MSITAIDGWGSPGKCGNGAGYGEVVEVRKTVTINAAPEALYRFWRDFGNLPRFVPHLDSVRVVSPRRSRWQAKGPAGSTMTWDVEIVEDHPNTLIAWRSLPGGDTFNAGVVRLTPAPADRGTEVQVTMRYLPPEGCVGDAEAKVFGEAPEQQLQEALRHLKQVIETGMIVHSEATIHDYPHPAQPSGRGTHAAA